MRKGPLPSPRPLGVRRNPHEGRCILVTGKLGSGKTAYMVTRGYKWARAYRLPVYANAPIRPDATVFRSWDDLRDLPLCQDGDGMVCKNGCHLIPDHDGCHPAIILLDELHLWYPSAGSISPPKEMMQDAFELLSYARKRGWTVMATSQAPKRVHTGFRQLVTEFVQVRDVLLGLWHRAALLDDDGKVEFPAYGSFSPRRARYNTRAEVRPLWSEAKRARHEPARLAPGPVLTPVVAPGVTEGPPPIPAEWRH